MHRYSRNMSMLSEEENNKLKDFKACVVGCGGLGGYIIEMLGRLGIGQITAVDGDCFDESNLNRQLLSDEQTLGSKKALAAKKRMEKVNPLIKVYPYTDRLDEKNAAEILSGHHVVMDALDNIKSRLVLQKAASELDIPVIHGAIAGWYGQVSCVFPGDTTYNLIYPDKEALGMEKELGNPSFTPALVASIQVSEALKVLLKRGSLLRNQLLIINLLDNEYEVIDLK